MHDRDRALQLGVPKVGVEARELARGEHPLVDDRPRGEARDHEVRPGGELGDATDHVQLALERVLVGGELRRRGDDDLPHERRDRARRLADVAQVDRHVAPADDALALGLDDAGEEPLELRGARRVVAREEAHAHAVLPGGREGVAQDPAEEPVVVSEQPTRIRQPTASAGTADAPPGTTSTGAQTLKIGPGRCSKRREE